MPLQHPSRPSLPRTDISVPPLFSSEPMQVPRHHLADGGLSPDVAYQLIHDELMLDGNARLNLATFVGTWMEPQAERLMAECFDKNMIDKDEYPATAELEVRCAEILAKLWHAPEATHATGCSTTGSSEAARSEEHTSELQSLTNLVCRLLLEKKKKKKIKIFYVKKNKTKI